MASQDKGRPLPKFGDWDPSDPASAEGFTAIFNKARDDKRTSDTAEVIASPRRNDKAFKQTETYKRPSQRRWFCCG